MLFYKKNMLMLLDSNGCILSGDYYGLQPYTWYNGLLDLVLLGRLDGDG